MGNFALKPKPVPRQTISGFAPILRPTPVTMVDAKSPTKKAAKPKAPAAHPPVATMVKASVTALKERNGSFLPAIKKYIAANYKVDMVKLNRFVNKSLKNLAEKGELTKVKGSYKLAKAKEEKKPKAKKPAAKKPAAKKATPKKKTAAKPKAASKPKAPSKKAAKKTTAPKKSPAKKAPK